MKAFQTISTNSEVGKHVKAFEIEHYVNHSVTNLTRHVGSYTLRRYPNFQIAFVLFQLFVGLCFKVGSLRLY